MASKKFEKSVVFLACYGVDPDVRIEKEAKALHEAGWRVTILGRDRSGDLPEREAREYATVYRIRIPKRSKTTLSRLWRFAQWQFRLVLWLTRHRDLYSVIHATNILTAYPALLVGALHRKPVVYDLFDLYADTACGLPRFLQKLLRVADLWAIGRATATILPDENRLRQISGSNPKRVVYIYNSPEQVPLNAVARHDGSYQARIAYFGCLEIQRGLLEILNAVEKHPEWHLDLGGFADEAANPIVRKALELKNVTWHGQLPYEQVLRLSAEADVLIATYDPAVPNHRYSSANKLFEAMMLGKPIIVARDTGMDSLVMTHSIGKVVEYGDVDALEAAIKEIIGMSPDQKEKLAQKAREIYLSTYSWENMKNRLVDLYNSL